MDWCKSLRTSIRKRVQNKRNSIQNWQSIWKNRLAVITPDSPSLFRSLTNLKGPGQEHYQVSFDEHNPSKSQQENHGKYVLTAIEKQSLDALPWIFGCLRTDIFGLIFATVTEDSEERVLSVLDYSIRKDRRRRRRLRIFK